MSFTTKPLNLVINIVITLGKFKFNSPFLLGEIRLVGVLEIVDKLVSESTWKFVFVFYHNCYENISK